MMMNTASQYDRCLYKMLQKSVHNLLPCFRTLQNETLFFTQSFSSLARLPLPDLVGYGVDVLLHVVWHVARQLLDDGGQVGVAGLLQDGLEDLTLDVVLKLSARVTPTGKRNWQKTIDHFRNVFNLWMFLLLKPSDQPLHSPASSNMISIARSWYSLCIRSLLLRQALWLSRTTFWNITKFQTSLTFTKWSIITNLSNPTHTSLFTTCLHV